MKCQFCSDKEATNLRYKPSEDYGMAYDLCDECRDKHKKAWEEITKGIDFSTVEAPEKKEAKKTKKKKKRYFCSSCGAECKVEEIIEGFDVNDGKPIKSAYITCPHAPQGFWKSFFNSHTKNDPVGGPAYDRKYNSYYF